jgi:ComF family protein
MRWAAPVPRCTRCALEVPAGVAMCGTCLVEPPPWDGADAAVGYDAPWDRLVAAFKFHEALDLAPAFADLMLETCDPGRARPAWLLPVPLSARRLRERGYNQAWELARRLARRLGTGADAHLLLRIRDTPHQLALPPGERAANVRGAFAVEPLRAAEVRGRHITVVDDVMTTGATAAEIARVLRAAGAARVDVWVLARTPRPEAAGAA